MSLSKVRRAYGATKGCQFLLQAITEPLSVPMEPVEFRVLLSGKSEQDCRWMAVCVSQGLCILHNAGWYTGMSDSPILYNY